MKKRWIASLTALLALVGSHSLLGGYALAFDREAAASRAKERQNREELAFVHKAVVAADRLIIGNSTLYELDKNSGKVLSKLPLKSAVGADILYIDGTAYVVTIDSFVRAVKNGKELWKTRLSESGFSLTDPATMKASGDYLCIAGSDYLTCLQRSSGKLLWKQATPNRIGFRMLFSAGKIYAPDAAKRFTAYDLATGKTIWKETGNSFEDVGPVLIKDGALYASHGDDGIFTKLDLKTGKTLFTNKNSNYEIRWDPIFPLPGNQLAVRDRNRGLLIFDCNTGKEYKYAPADRPPVVTRSDQNVETNVDVFLLHSNVLYAGGNAGGTGIGGYMSAFDPLSRKQKWLTAIDEKNINIAIPSPAGDPVMISNQLIAPLDTGVVYSVNPASGKVLWKTETGRHWQGSTPSCGPRIYASQNAVCVYDHFGVTGLNAQTGKKLWTISTDNDAIVLNPIQDGERLYIQTIGGSLHTLDISRGTVVWTFTADGAAGKPAIATREGTAPASAFSSSEWINARKDKNWSRKKLMEHFCKQYKSDLDGARMERNKVIGLLGQPELSSESPVRESSEHQRWRISDTYALSDKSGSFDINYDPGGTVTSYHWSDERCEMSDHGVSKSSRATVELARKSCQIRSLTELEEVLGPPDRFEENIPLKFPTPLRYSTYIWKLSGDGRKILWVRTTGRFDSDLKSRAIDVYSIISASPNCPFERK